MEPGVANFATLKKNKILLCICDGMNIAFNGFYNFVFSIVSSLSDFDYYKYVTL